MRSVSIIFIYIYACNVSPFCCFQPDMCFICASRLDIQPSTRNVNSSYFDDCSVNRTVCVFVRILFTLHCINSPRNTLVIFRRDHERTIHTQSRIVDSASTYGEWFVRYSCYHCYSHYKFTE